MKVYKLYFREYTGGIGDHAVEEVLGYFDSREKAEQPVLDAGLQIVDPKEYEGFMIEECEVDNQLRNAQIIAREKKKYEETQAWLKQREQASDEDPFKNIFGFGKW